MASYERGDPVEAFTGFKHQLALKIGGVMLTDVVCEATGARVHLRARKG